MILLYILSFTMIILVLSVGYFINQSSKKNLDKFSSATSEQNITGKELANKLITQNNLKNVKVVNLKSNHTNYYSLQYNVLKFDPEIANSTTLLSLATSAYHTNKAKFHQKHTLFSIIRTIFNYIFKAISAIFLPLVLICAILNISSSTHAPMFAILFSLIFYCLAFIVELIFLVIELKNTKKYIKDLKDTKLFNENELEILKTNLKIVTKYYFFSYTRWTLAIFWLISPDFIFRQK